MLAGLAVDDVQAAIYSLCALIVVLAILALFRILLRKESRPWRRLRFGLFVERDPEPPTSEPWPGQAEEDTRIR